MLGLVEPCCDDLPDANGGVGMMLGLTLSIVGRPLTMPGEGVRRIRASMQDMMSTASTLALTTTLQQAEPWSAVVVPELFWLPLPSNVPFMSDAVSWVSSAPGEMAITGRPSTTSWLPLALAVKVP